MTSAPNQSEEDFEQEEVVPWLESAGWDVINAEEQPPQTRETYNRSEEEPIFWNVLKRKLQDINDLQENQAQVILDNIQRRFSVTSNLVETNQDVIGLLRSGGTYEDPENDYKDESYDLFDFGNIDNNEFKAVSQFTYEGTSRRRPDIVLFVNGLPLVVIEIKNIHSGYNPSAATAIKDLKNTYEKQLKDLFASNVFNVALSQTELQYGAIHGSLEHYHYWKPDESSQTSSNIEEQVKDLLQPERILDILENFTFFKEDDNPKNEDPYVKIIPRHQQYFAVKEILDDIEDNEETGDFARELIVHVQGSGKTYAMIFAANILTRKYNYPVYIIVDEKKLIDQFGDDLRKIKEVQENIIDSSEGTESGSNQLKEAVEKSRPEVILTIIHLFNEMNTGQDTPVESSKDSIVFADEAHRFLEDILGSMMEKTLDPFHYYGFTGTPIESTYQEFDSELHRYSMGDAVDEEAILPVDLRSRRDMLEWKVNEEMLDKRFDEEIDVRSEVEKRRILSEAIGTEDLAGLESRMNVIVDDIVQHYENDLREGEVPEKGMVVTKGKKNAAMYGKKLQNVLGKEKVDVIYSSNKDDPEIVQDFHKNGEELKNTIENFEDADSEPNIIVVCDMLRTGFDAPIVRTIYLDRRFQSGHTLLQTIARTNRPREGKKFGEIIDYQGSTENFDDLVGYDSDEIEEFTSEDRDQFKQEFKRQLTKIVGLFDSYSRPEFKLPEPSNEELVDLSHDLDSYKAQLEFKREFQALRELYDNLSPDPFLADYIEEYTVLKGIYNVVNVETKSGTDEVTEDMLNLLQEEIEVEEKEVFDEKSRRVEYMDDDHPVKVSRKKNKLQNILRKKWIYDPKYEKLSERVDDIIEKWDQNKITNNEAITRLGDVEEETRRLTQEIQNDDLTIHERAIKSKIEEYLPEVSNSEQMSIDIVKQFDEEKPDMDEWWSNKSKRDNVIKSKVIYEIVLRYGIEEENFIEKEEIIIDEISQYLIEKERSNESSISKLS